MSARARDGVVVRVGGPIVHVSGMAEAGLLDLVEVGERCLPGEVIALAGDLATVQVHAHTGGLRPGEPVRPSGRPLSAQLGPGLLGGLFDGMLRPLADAGDRLEAGSGAPALSASREWDLAPALRPGDEVGPGAIIGRLAETPAVEHRPLVPPWVSGRVEWVAPAGAVRVDDPVARIGGHDVALAHLWPVRRPRPVAVRRPAGPPLWTGQRVIDALFPVSRGSTAAVPGGFGTGKTLLLQQVAKWCDADVIVYVGCGERGNELADVLDDLRAIEDPRSGRALLDRTVIVANTSNMPVMAREASVYTGVAVAEYYRDMGHDAVVIADSTSRWAEALREVASRTDELPAEEGYPARLASTLAAVYERAARVRTLAGADAALTLIGAVSPPGGDMAEPVTSHTRRFVRCVWSLDRDLAHARRHPAVSWRDSSSRDAAAIAAWHAGAGDPEWGERRARALALLAEADALEATAQLIGADALPDRERVTLLAARLLREGVLQQNALSPADAYCGALKQAELLRLVLAVGDRCLRLVARGVPASVVEALDLSEVVRAREASGPEDAEPVGALRARVLARLEALAARAPATAAAAPPR